jgi:hypothetical protein
VISQNSAEAVPAFSLGSHGERTRLAIPPIPRAIHQIPSPASSFLPSATAASAFSLPVCVSKACSILEAVADLNSSSSENKSFELDRSVNDKEPANGRYGGGKAAWQVVESEVVVKDDLMEPSLHKYVSVRDTRWETEPQESAGSNSFAGNAWTCSWGPNLLGKPEVLGVLGSGRAASSWSKHEKMHIT